MKLICTGHPSRISRDEARAAALFYLQLLMPRYNTSKIQLRLRFKRGFRKKYYAMGGVKWFDRGNRPTKLAIDLDADLSKSNTLLTLAHEMVHVKQYIKGELQDFRAKRTTKWQGKLVDEDKIYYYDLPWEIEAHGREMGLYTRWKHRND
jgi:hypothetical protein